MGTGAVGMRSSPEASGRLRPLGRRPGPRAVVHLDAHSVELGAEVVGVEVVVRAARVQPLREQLVDLLDVHAGQVVGARVVVAAVVDVDRRPLRVGREE